MVTKTTKGTRNKKIEAVEAQAVLDSVKDLDLNKVVNEISGLQVSVQNTLAGLSATLTNKVQKMQQVETAISLKEQRLSDLFQIEKEAVSLDDLKASKEEEAKNWERDREERELLWAEQEADRQKAWERAEEEHVYAMNQAKKRAQEDFQAEMATSQRNERTRQDVLLREWAEREAAIKSKENEFAELKTQAEGFDARIKQAISQSEAVLSNVLKKNHEHEMELLKKDMEAERTLHNVKTSAMDDTITNLEQQIADLRTSLAAALADAKDVASQALQSASGRQVSEALQKVLDRDQPNMKTK